MLVSLAIISMVLQFATALFVISKNHKSATNFIFSLLSITVMTWAALGFFFFPASIEIVRLIMFTVVLQVTLFRLFAKSFPSNRIEIRKKRLFIYIGFAILVGLVALSPILFVKVVETKTGNSPVPGPGMPIFLIFVIFSTVSGIRTLSKKYRNAKTLLEKRQLKFILLGSYILWAVVPITNFIFTVITQNVTFILVGPIYTFLFSSVIAYAIIKQKMFDIKGAVARSVTYILSLGFIGVTYGVVIYIISNYLLSGSLSETTQKAFYIGLAVASSIFYRPVKIFFNKVTNKLFFQDTYDSQEFLDEINKLLVGEIQLENLLKGIVGVLEENLKCAYCVFVVRETAYEPLRIVGTKQHHFDKDSTKELRELALHTKSRLIMTDELDDNQSELGQTLHKLDISALIRLVSTTSYDLEGMGYLVVGPKKNGNIYTDQDTKVLSILANEMVITIENALRFEEIEKFNLTLQQKIDDATAQLKRTNQKLKTIDEAKDEFISMASHQLRTPLTSVKGYLSMVLEGDAGEVGAMQRKLLDQAFMSSQRMVYLIADLLNLSRLKTGKFIIDAVPTDLSKVLEDEVDQLRETATSRDLKLEYKRPINFPVFMLDETKLRQVMMNFMDNSIYYTPSGGEITVKLEETEKTIEFTVTDNGIGIPKREQAHLFTKFFRAGNAKKARPDGTGLGLFMVKKVIIAQGGSIIFKSSEGKGSTFGFAFDKSKLARPTETEDKPIDI